MTYESELTAIGVRADSALATVEAANAALTTSNAALNSSNSALTATVAERDALIVTLRARIAELEAGQPTTPPPTAPAFSLSAGAVTISGGYGSFRLSLNNLPSGVTSVQAGHDGGGNASFVWSDTVAVSSFPLLAEWLVPNKTYVFTVTAGTQTASVSVLIATGGTTPPPPSGSTGTDNRAGTMTFAIANSADFKRDVDQIAAAGHNWIRIGLPEAYAGSISGTTWTPNVTNMNEHVAAIDYAKSKGLKIVQVIADTIKNTSWTEAQFRSTQSQFWGYVSQRVGSKVDLWQIFNEHDVQDYRSGAGLSSTWTNTAYLARWKDALAAARTAIRQYSSAPVTTSLWGWPGGVSWQTQYDRWVAIWDVIGPSCDVIGIHAYPEDGAANLAFLTQAIKNLAARYAKKVYLGEYGMNDGYGATRAGTGLVAEVDAVFGAQSSLICACQFTWRNRGADNDTNGENTSGVVKNGGTDKSYSAAYRSRIQALPKL